MEETEDVKQAMSEWGQSNVCDNYHPQIEIAVLVLSKGSLAPLQLK